MASRGGKYNRHRRGGRKQFTAYGTGEGDVDAFEGAAAEPGYRNKKREVESTSEEEGTGSEEEEQDSESEAENQEGEDQKRSKTKAEPVIETANPNHATKTHFKASTLGASGGAAPLSRREREAIEKERAKQAYWKAHLAGKTEQARADMARLALIRKQREEAVKKREEEAKAKAAASSSKASSLSANKSLVSEAARGGRKK